jgi:hypothetical protein
MNNSVIPYKIDESVIRAYEKDGENWFVAKDVLELLKLQRNSLAKIKDEWKGFKIFGKQRLTTIKEAGMWKLAMRSNLPEAQRFQDWLAEEVIPSLRKYGTYTLQRENLKPGYKEISSNVFGIIGSKEGGITAVERVANFINKAVVGMTAKECKDKYGIAPREYVMKALKLAQSKGNKAKEDEYKKKLDEYDSVQHIVNHFLENGGHPLEVKSLLKNMKYNL